MTESEKKELTQKAKEQLKDKTKSIQDNKIIKK